MIKKFDSFLNESFFRPFNVNLMNIYDAAKRWSKLGNDDKFDDVLNRISQEEILFLKKDDKVVIDGKLKFKIIRGIGSGYLASSMNVYRDQLLILNGKDAIVLKMPTMSSNGDLEGYYLSNRNTKKIISEVDPYGEEDWDDNSENFHINESIKGIKDYGISNILDNNYEKSIQLEYYKSFKLYKNKIGENSTFSQFKKSLNNIFINKPVMFVSYSPGKMKHYLIQDIIKSLSVDKDGNIKSFDCVKNGVCLYNEDFGVINIIKYVELLKKLIGQKILFYQRYKNILLNITLNDILLKKDNIYFVDNDGKKYEADIYKTIIKAPILSIEDPWGEEDWDDSNERFLWKKGDISTSIRLDDLQFVSIRKEITEYLRLHQGDLSRNILKFFKENMINEKIKVNCTKIITPYKFISKGNVKKGKIEDGYFELTLMNINHVGGNIFQIFDEEYKYIATTGNLMNCMSLRKINRVVNVFDPLGEEDWDD